MKRIQISVTELGGYKIVVNGKQLGYVAKNHHHPEKYENSEAVCTFTSLHYAARSLISFHKNYIEV